MITTDKKEIDVNGYITYFDVPMTEIGVFPYLGRTISPELEPDRVYNVLRPKEELTNPETLKSLENIPFVDDHTMIGDGFTPAEKKGVHGVTGKNVKVNGDLITNDLIAYSDTIKDLIERNKRDLSMGYRCRYELTNGEYNGQPYDAIQRDIRFNHIALVDEGRMGAECRVTDNAIVYDRLDIKPQVKELKMAKIVLDEDLKEEIKEELKEELKQDLLGGQPEIEEEEKKEIVDGCDPAKDEEEEKPVMDEDKRKLIDEIGGILNGKVDEEILKTVLKKAEELAYNPSETGANDEDEDPDKKPEIEEKKEEISMDEMIKTIALRDELVSKVSPIIGDNINYKKMTVSEVVAYACDKLDIKPSLKGLQGYLNGYSKANKNIQVTVATDKAFKPTAKSPVIMEYLKK